MSASSTIWKPLASRCVGHCPATAGCAVELTAKGRRLIKTVHRASRDPALLERLKPTEQEQLFRLLRKFLDEPRS